MDSGHTGQASLPEHAEREVEADEAQPRRVVGQLAEEEPGPTPQVKDPIANRGRSEPERGLDLDGLEGREALLVVRGVSIVGLAQDASRSAQRLGLGLALGLGLPPGGRAEAARTGARRGAAPVGRAFGLSLTPV